MMPVVVLAGGRGARMAGNKPFHAWGQTTLIEATLERLSPYTDDLIINAGAIDGPWVTRLAGLGLPMIYDDLPWRGPLSGVLSALERAEQSGWPHIITCPCDMPALPDDYVARLEQAPATAIACYAGERDYPLCARWQTALRPALEKALRAAPSGLRVMDFIKAHVVHIVAVAHEADFANINRA
ncbi:molybdenum cofactor guanylyltransferase [Asticcacaulis sp. EMRT-3]|uniref:molybdenum cofactor guanylyltransferase n=1 Tax=Asticcacaulis sp. EMRT-3 TaxID=3040349 RepID=UPI0024AF307B|nr:molybdenum cofactor guanylyltransferase [Asticcacaulis sp. EMRT-3]MDI7775714.1 molybdenum cofactor guanylyltransferase [Asticcacaulis sp. EMRT-3]